MDFYLTNDREKLESILTYSFGVKEEDLEKAMEVAYKSDCIDTDFPTYKKDVCKSYTDGYLEMVNDLLDSDFTSKDEDITMTSPIYYNFRSDKIFCEIEWKDENTQKLLELVNTYKKELTPLIKDNFTSYDGFISFVSNNIDDWIDGIQDPSDKNWEDYVSILIRFLLEITTNNDVECVLYEYVTDNNIYYENYVTLDKNGKELLKDFVNL